MSTIDSMVFQLQKDAMDTSVSVSHLLRKAKFIANELNQLEILIWIDRELKGYEVQNIGKLPPYRQIRATPIGYDRLNRPWPIRFDSSEYSEALSKAKILEPLGVLEEKIRQEDKGSFHIPYPHETDKALRESIDSEGLVNMTAMSIERSQILGIIEAVRDLIYDWSFDLKKVGIIGSNMSFDEIEKEKATSPSQQLINNITNYGTINGSIGGNLEQTQGSIINSTISNLDIDKITNFLRQLDEVLPHLPSELNSQIKLLAKEVKDEAVKNTPETSKIKGGIQKIIDICARVSDNLITQGIIALAKNLF